MFDLVGWIRSRRFAKLRTRGMIECSLRDPLGQTSKFLRRWRAGVASVEPGVITFEPFLPPGIRVRRPFTDPIVLRVVSVGNELRNSTVSEAWRFMGSVRTLQTEEGIVELGTAHDDDAEWVISILNRPNR